MRCAFVTVVYVCLPLSGLACVDCACVVLCLSLGYLAVCTVKVVVDLVLV